MSIFFNNIYSGKRVLITGNTGFKGSWLSLWLQSLGANVMGVALKPQRQNDPSCHLTTTTTKTKKIFKDTMSLVELSWNFNWHLFYIL